jgi:two-component system, sensor histidine kinase
MEVFGLEPARPLPAANARLEAELTRLLFHLGRQGLFFHGVLTALALFVTLPLFSTQLVGGWTTVAVITLAWRSWLQLRFHRRAAREGDFSRWRRAFIFGALLSAATWGAAGWFFFATDDVLPRIMMILIMCGINSAAARSLSSFPAAYAAFGLLSMGPLSVAIVVHLHDGAALVLLGMCLLFGLYLYHSAKAECAERTARFRLLYANEELLETLRESKDRAEAANVAKTGFLATMSHEIRTPMNGIIGMLQMLRASPLAHEQQEQVEIAAKSADALLRLLNDILDLSKIESDKLDFESLPFSPATAVEEVGRLLQARAIEKGVALIVETDPALPDALSGDAIRLKQVLLNLCGNALKFTERGQVHLTARLVAMTATAGTIHFSIRDTGIGMCEEVRSKLFQVFAQGDSSTSRRFGGSGLGLAISQRLVRRMGGEITVESQPQAGSHFRFELSWPLASAASAAPVAIATTAPRLSGRVLVAEDDRVNRIVISSMLKKLGLDCTVVEDGYQAVTHAREGSWDLMLMDVQMPGLDGLEATRQIKLDPAAAELPIVALTANVLPEHRDAAHAAGMIDFLSKPVRLHELRRCLEAHLPADPASGAPPVPEPGIVA